MTIVLLFTQEEYKEFQRYSTYKATQEEQFTSGCLYVTFEVKNKSDGIFLFLDYKQSAILNAIK